MPKAEIESHTVTVRLEAAEKSIDDLADKALALFRSALAELPGRSSIAMGAGSHLERRGTYDGHEPINAGGAR